MTKVLLSIKPHFADKIFSGQKKYEFRRAIFKREDVKKVIVYASSPVSKAIGEFEIETILLEDLHLLWKKTKNFAGITKGYFFSYFKGVDKGYAIRIKNYSKYPSPYCIRTILGVNPPQSFLYVDH